MKTPLTMKTTDSVNTVHHNLFGNHIFYTVCDRNINFMFIKMGYIPCSQSAGPAEQKIRFLVSKSSSTILYSSVTQENHQRVSIFFDYAKKTKNTAWSYFLPMLNRQDLFTVHMVSEELLILSVRVLEFSRFE